MDSQEILGDLYLMPMVLLKEYTLEEVEPIQQLKKLGKGITFMMKIADV